MTGVDDASEYGREGEHGPDAFVLGVWSVLVVSGVLMHGLTGEAVGYTLTGLSIYYACGIAGGGTIRGLTPFGGER